MPRDRQKTAAEPSPTNGNLADVLKQLWQAAVNLRGAIEPADYKRYVLPIIFLRFLSLRYEKRRREIELMIAEPQSDYFGAAKAVQDPDEYRRVGAFIIPEEARWENIRKIAQSDDIKVRLDSILELLENTYPDKLKGLLPRIYAGSNLDQENVTGLINLFSKDVFERDYPGEDLIGRVYEYFIGEFASSEGKRGGEYFTPSSIVRLLVAMLEPTEGKVFDPCCGSGGMFVQSDIFTHHSGNLAFSGQESKDFTYRLCRMNLFIHGIDGDIRLGNSYTDDKHEPLRADYLLANPPFNDGSKSENGWGADRIPNKDPRLSLGGEKMPLAPKNANTMWMLHFFHHLAEGGTAGFVMATGELSSGETARLDVRKALVDNGYVDCIVQLSGQLFANTQIPCTLWFLSKNRNGQKRFRERRDEILFIDARKLGALIPGSRKQKQLSDDDISRVASVYHTFKYEGVPEDVLGFCSVASIVDIRARKYALPCGQYVGSANGDDDEEDFEQKMPRLVEILKRQVEDSERLSKAISTELREWGYEA
jgi:type I restriction enzyme M protein